jgi:signal transduction histidine kinase
MSRATLSVDMLARNSGLWLAAQPSANAVASASSSGSGFPPGTAGSASAAAARCSSVRHRTASDPPTPRGSMPMTSNRASTSGEKVPGTPVRVPIARMVSEAGTPGPPGLKNRVPMRCAGSVARWRITASGICSPRGSVYSSGTSTVVQSRFGPHSCQATGAGEAAIAGAATAQRLPTGALRPAGVVDDTGRAARRARSHRGGVGQTRAEQAGADRLVAGTAAAAETEAQLRAEHSQHEAREALAREMHDVLGHRLSLLSVSAGALVYGRGATAEEITRAAEAVRENARRALQDLREVIGVLRAPEGDIPLPGVQDVVELVGDGERSGAPVRLQDLPGVTTGDRLLPDTAGRTVYRLVQEGLTNARKHAPGALVVVRITGEPGHHLDVEVVNEPAAVPSTPAIGSGEGLRGLVERATLVGGRVEHGPTGSGGWRLRMRLRWPA